MEFKQFKQRLQDNFATLTKDATHLFEVEVDKDEMWNVYLESFPPQFNKIFRERREHDCSCCRQFIKNIGNAVVIKDNKITSIWDFEIDSEEYSPSVKAMSQYIHSKVVSNIYVSKFNAIGTDSNFELLSDGKQMKWEHFYLQLPTKFVDKSSRSEGDIKGGFRDIRNVFKRSLDEISQDSVETVLELILSNTLYKGEEWKSQLQEFLKHKKEYSKLTDKEKEMYAWEKSVVVGAVIGKIRNHSIGTLLTNISEGMDLDLAVKKYEQIVAPSNYKRPKAIFTQKMLDEAKNTIEELGYMDSLSRRYAVLDDITVNNILFSNRDSAKKIKGSVFDDMAVETINPKKFSKVEEISADKFIQDILPTAKELEVYLENKHTNNMVSLIAPQVSDAKTMFKWNNNFSWAYSGNITDSEMKDRVKSAGGKVDGDLRFSIQWNDITRDSCDLDAHCIEPDRYEIYYGNKRELSPSKGMLDVDIISPSPNTPAVENITYANRNTMKDGNYKFFVRYFSGRTTSGFRAEIEFDGQIYAFETKDNMSGDVHVATVNLKDGVFTIKEELKSSVSSRDIWNLKTNQFVPVSVACYSPNYWDEQDNIGHRHLLFMLKDCVNSESPNGFFNEFLKEDLMKHKRVFEALGGKMRVEDSENQLSGLGFSMTKRAELVVKVKSQTERIFKVKF